MARIHSYIPSTHKHTHTSQICLKASSDEVTIPDNLPISEADLASLKVTTVVQTTGEGPKSKGGAGMGIGEASIVISAKTGETTVVMKEVRL